MTRRATLRQCWLLTPLVLGGCLLAPDAPLAFNGQLGPTFDVGGQASFQAEFIFDEIPGKAGSHAPTITALPDGTLIAAWYSYAGPHELDGAAIYMSRKAPGAAWQTPWLHADHPGGEGNPVLHSEGARVWLFYALAPGGWSTANLRFQISDDEGQTWSASKAIAGPLGANVRFPPIRLQSGELLLPAYNDLWQRSLFFVSETGEHWRLRSHLATEFPQANQNTQPSAVELANGRLLAVMRNTQQGHLWVAGSDDGGISWTRPQDANFANPGSPAQLLRLASGRLALVYNDSATQRTPLTIALSADAGRSWPHRRVLVTGDGAYSYPTAIQTADGAIHVVYSHDRETIAHMTISEAWIAE